MKNYILIPLLIGGALVAFFSFKYVKALGDESDDKKVMILRTVMKTIDAGHYEPRTLDDTFSARVYDDIIKTLDYDKRFFTRQNMNILSTYRFKIDDEIRNEQFDFYNQLSNIYNQRIAATEGLYKELLTQPFSFNGNDSINLAGDEMPYATNDEQVKDRWNKYLKYRVLARYIDIKKEQEKNKTNKDSIHAKKKTEAEMESEARAAILKNQDQIFKRLKKYSEQELFNFYINSITSTEDPHTNYFAPQDKKKFDEGMSGSFMGIGAQLSEQEGKIKITAIIVGSPSWKQGELKAGDEILKVGQGETAPEDITGLELDDVVKKIRGTKGTVVKLTVKKIDGSQKIIPIERGKVDLAETFAKSAIINSPMGKIGYLILPEFYADFENPNGRRSSSDIKKEIEKLKAENIKGIVFDLRNNGGGSLSDVVDIVGMFIKQGPVVQVKSKEGNAVTLSDNNSQLLYDGPLAVMINQGSASASEIFAAAIQDYKRGVVIGANSFGKGTVQRVVGLDEVLDITTRLKSGFDAATLGHLKLTVQKFYRINGGSTQMKGVVPDVVLPDIYDQLKLGERKEITSLPWTEIAKVNYNTTNSVSDMAGLVAKSKARVDKNEVFKLIQQNALKLKAMEKDNVYSLNEQKFRQKMDQNAKQSEKMEELEKKGSPLNITNLKIDLADINRDTSTVAKNADWIKSITKDVYLSETVNVLLDMARASMPRMEKMVTTEVK